MRVPCNFREKCFSQLSCLSRRPTSSARFHSQTGSVTGSGCLVKALDAAQPFDYESRAAAKLQANNALKIGIVGFGTFGQFLAKRMVTQGHKVCSRCWVASRMLVAVYVPSHGSSLVLQWATNKGSVTSIPIV
jgi:hypothetical protein